MNGMPKLDVRGGAPVVLPQHIASCRSPGAIAVMAALVDRCTVNGEEVVPLLGGIYGAWITSPITFWS
jgi:hypothetical protein